MPRGKWRRCGNSPAVPFAMVNHGGRDASHMLWQPGTPLYPSCASSLPDCQERKVTEKHCLSTHRTNVPLLNTLQESRLPVSRQPSTPWLSQAELTHPGQEINAPVAPGSLSRSNPLEHVGNSDLCSWLGVKSQHGPDKGRYQLWVTHNCLCLRGGTGISIISHLSSSLLAVADAGRQPGR